MDNQKLNNIRKLLQDENPKQVEIFLAHCLAVSLKTNSNKQRANAWIDHRRAELLAGYFKMVVADGMVFDGKHIVLVSTGVSYDYMAYKNKMLIAYPETKIDIQLVHQGDKFTFQKQSGEVIYTHEISNPFGGSTVIGCYCVIKNKRGEFLTLLDKDDIAKHRKVSKTDKIWSNWFDEMVLKTVVKKACKTHFADVYEAIETLDNEQYDLDKLDKKATAPLKPAYEFNDEITEQWKQYFRSGTQPERLITTIKTKYHLTAEQEQQIRDIHKATQSEALPCAS